MDHTPEEMTPTEKHRLYDELLEYFILTRFREIDRPLTAEDHASQRERAIEACRSGIPIEISTQGYQGILNSAYFRAVVEKETVNIFHIINKYLP